jgi:AraC family transcriptional regulator, transcriptional activator of pobA
VCGILDEGTFSGSQAYIRSLNKQDKMIYRGVNQEFLQLEEIQEGDVITFDTELALPLLFVWVRGENAEILSEGTTIRIPNNTILCITVFQQIKFSKLDNARFIKFNKEFYCVLNHDSEVSCKGILFFNSNQLPFFPIPEEELEKFETLWKMFEIEMKSKDELQLEMLQMMLKRFIILCTRVYKAQNNFLKLEDKEVDIVREFNFLVEQYFKTKHSVKDYADLLNKSPKTLSNIFTQLAGKSPLQIIHERKALEAKRMLRYTDKSIKEIAFELGFEDIQAFSRFFKKIERISPSGFKKLL